MRKLVSYVAGIFRDQNGKPSACRFACGFLLGGYLYIMLRAHAIPSNTDQFAILITSVYGSNCLRNGLAAARNATGSSSESPASASAAN